MNEYPKAGECNRCEKCWLEPTARACWTYEDEPETIGVVVPKAYKDADMF